MRIELGLAGVGSEKLWRAYCQLIGAEQTLMNDPRYATNSARNANRPTLLPQLDDTFVAGVPLSWLLLGAGVYPLAVTVGALYVRAASRNEARYRSLTEDE